MTVSLHANLLWSTSSQDECPNEALKRHQHIPQLKFRESHWSDNGTASIKLRAPYPAEPAKFFPQQNSAAGSASHTSRIVISNR